MFGNNTNSLSILRLLIGNFNIIDQVIAICMQTVFFNIIDLNHP